jgi:type I restriction enzyme S subunit
MALKQFNVDFLKLSKDMYLRMDEKYHIFLNSSNWNLFGSKNKNLIPLKDILLDDYNLFNYEDGEEYKGIPTGQTYLDEDGEIKDFQLVTKEDHPGRLKYKVSNDNILISSLRLAKSPALYFENQDLSDYVFSDGFYIYKVKEGWNRKFVLYVLRTKKLKNILDEHIYRGIGISAYKDDDLKKIKIPLIPKTTQDQIVAQIEPIEQKIKNLKKTVKEPQEIINKVFAREFGFDENLYNEFGKGMTAGTQIAQNRTLRVFETDFKELARSKIIRFSTRFHNPPTKKLMDLLDSIDTLQVKDVISEDIHRGASPKYDTDGEIPVVKTGHLKNGYIEISQDEFVNQDFYDLSTRSQVKKGDILIASTGKVSLGKIDLLEDDQDLVADGHVSIIRINEEKYNPLFFTYFFRSILGYFQIERDFTGATNQVELYANEISNFQIPDIDLQTQQKIVDEIKAELDKQEEISKKIEIERNKIEEIIVAAIS